MTTRTFQSTEVIFAKGPVCSIRPGACYPAMPDSTWFAQCLVGSRILDLTVLTVPDSAPELGP